VLDALKKAVRRIIEERTQNRTGARMTDPGNLGGRLETFKNGEWVLGPKNSRGGVVVKRADLSPPPTPVGCVRFHHGDQRSIRPWSYGLDYKLKQSKPQDS